jgi:hypothetical protein
MTEFGHKAFIGGGMCIDSWGVGPFVIAAGGKSFRFEDSDRFGPSLVKKNGDIAANPWPATGSPFWRAHRIWVRQGRRLEDGKNCIWDEPKPQILKRIGGRHYIVIQNGEEDGETIFQK